MCGDLPERCDYKREEDGIVLIDQDKCRGWRCASPDARTKKSISTGRAVSLEVHLLLSAY